MVDDYSHRCSGLIITDENEDDDSSLALSSRVAKPQPSMVIGAGDEGSVPKAKRMGKQLLLCSELLKEFTISLRSKC